MVFFFFFKENTTKRRGRLLWLSQQSIRVKRKKDEGGSETAAVCKAASFPHTNTHTLTATDTHFLYTYDSENCISWWEKKTGINSSTKKCLYDVHDIKGYRVQNIHTWKSTNIFQQIVKNNCLKSLRFFAMQWDRCPAEEVNPLCGIFQSVSTQTRMAQPTGEGFLSSPKAYK